MIKNNRKIIPALSLFALMAATIIGTPALAQRYNGPAYQASPVTSIDYRNVTTLNDFKRLVYKNRWSNISATDVLAQFTAFKGGSSSPAIRDIWLDILVSDFDGLSFDDNTQQTRLMSERIRLLNELGFFDEAVRLYQRAADKKPVPEAIVRQGVEALALSGSADGTCIEVYMAAKHFSLKDWDQDAALCAVYFGESKRASELYNKISKQSAKGFHTVYKMVNEDKGKAIHITMPALWRTILLSQRATVSASALKNADPMTMAALAASPRVPLSIRLSAASKAADNGTISAERLRQLYELKHETESGLSGIINSAIAGANLPQHDYYGAARFHFQSNDRAKIVKNAMHDSSPVTHIKSHVYSWVIDKLTLHIKSLGWFAPEGYSLMLLTKRTSSAAKYYKAGNLEQTPFKLVDAIANNKAWTSKDREQWKDSMRKRYKKSATQKIEDFLFLASAYDQDKMLGIPPVKSDPDALTLPTPLFLTIEKGGKGLTLVTALNIFSMQKQWNKFDNTTFANMIELMTREGLFGERKKITLEFLIQTML